ncbi:hypothetical protein E2C01_050673 [Portunus trituberculatus]|uniref:Uncharacterized protein n=1 Tax=Portunus trituberculatus TaxID=210409 RepID=A0A5B7GI58_PORTR|nr:hypothetical protein [Portunus trituberculatus]
MSFLPDKVLFMVRFVSAGLTPLSQPGGIRFDLQMCYSAILSNICGKDEIPPLFEDVNHAI